MLVQIAEKMLSVIICHIGTVRHHPEFLFFGGSTCKVFPAQCNHIFFALLHQNLTVLFLQLSALFLCIRVGHESLIISGQDNGIPGIITAFYLRQMGKFAQ